MDWKQKKKKIRKNSYSLGAFACCFGLGIMGALFVYFSDADSAGCVCLEGARL